MKLLAIAVMSHRPGTECSACECTTGNMPDEDVIWRITFGRVQLFLHTRCLAGLGDFTSNLPLQLFSKEQPYDKAEVQRSYSTREVHGSEREQRVQGHTGAAQG